MHIVFRIQGLGFRVRGAWLAWLYSLAVYALVATTDSASMLRHPRVRKGLLFKATEESMANHSSMLMYGLECLTCPKFLGLCNMPRDFKMLDVF